jgi:hypothetical protein
MLHFEDIVQHFRIVEKKVMLLKVTATGATLGIKEPLSLLLVIALLTLKMLSLLKMIALTAMQNAVTF